MVDHSDGPHSPHKPSKRRLAGRARASNGKSATDQSASRPAGSMTTVVRAAGKGLVEYESEQLRHHPLQWSPVIAARAALRMLPATRFIDELEDILSIFRANAVALFSAKHPNSALGFLFSERSLYAAEAASNAPDETAQAASAAARVAAYVSAARESSGAEAATAFEAASEAISEARSAAARVQLEIELLAAINQDLRFLQEGASWQKLVDMPLWPEGEPSYIANNWHTWMNVLREDGDHWSVWLSWYGSVVAGHSSTEAEDAAFVDVPNELPWGQGREAIGSEIRRRLNAIQPDPRPLDGISSPITINRRPDGRIGVEAGPFSVPTVPSSLSPTDHHSALSACRNRAVQLTKVASSPNFQGRSDYAQILREYIDWLPGETATGNMLLADGEARILNKLFAAEEAILPTVFASKLSVFLEDHIGLRSFYPEVERHYQAVNTGRLSKPLSRDAAEAIQRIIRSQTPIVFDETLSPAVDEAAKPIPNFDSLQHGELPPPDPSRPKPPHDPIADADPQKSRSYVLASAFNRIWSLLQKGKDTAQAIEGWHKTYELMKPHIGAVLDFLRSFLNAGGGAGGPPPSIGI